MPVFSSSPSLPPSLPICMLFFVVAVQSETTHRRSNDVGESELRERLLAELVEKEDLARVRAMVCGEECVAFSRWMIDGYRNASMSA